MNNSFAQDFQSFRVMCEETARHESRRLVIVKPVWVFGAGHFGRDVCSILLGEGFDVQGFIESKPRDERVIGLPVMTWSELHADQLAAQLVVGIFNREMPLDQLQKLCESAGFTDIFMPWDVYSQFGKQLGWRFWLSAPSIILESLSAIEKTYRSLADDISRRCLLEICAFRLGCHTAYAGFSHADRQYFNDLTLKSAGDRSICYVDGGAYNGDTYFELSAHAEVNSAYLFEPDPDNFKALVTRITTVSKPVVCMPLALADCYQVMSFNGGNGEGGSILENGMVHIATAALDEMLMSHHIDFIKLDIEGAEILALRGSMGIIKRCRPILAISIYHRPKDICEIPELLEQLCDNYSFYIRQHFYNSFDSVLYAIPKH